MSEPIRIPLLKVSQWLPSWDLAAWAPPHLPKPAGHFFIGSISLLTLRRLTGVGRRQISERKNGGRGAGIQRAHQGERSKSIARYLQYGYPISGEPAIEPTEHPALIHPGWIPTSILVNVIGTAESRRRGGRELSVNNECRVVIQSEGDNHVLKLPASTFDRDFRVPDGSLEPIEVIDGQHRLFAVDAFGDQILSEDYQVPVVFFDGLTESWQAYLFWVINVEPKKINPSLAYDLYPELRSQSWLESGESIKVYQEHRAQELTEVMWRHEASPWRHRIELHGNRVEGHVSNAAFIRSLMSSFVKRWGNANRIGGLFGSTEMNHKERVLPWKRSQQAAFLITCWRHVHEAVRNSKAAWVAALKKENKMAAESLSGLHPAFAGSATLLGTDQGVRAILVVFNAVCQIAYVDLELEAWESDRVSDMPEDDDVSEALNELEGLALPQRFLANIASHLIDNLDWRTSSSPSLTEEESQAQAAYRGSSGYSILQSKCLFALKGSKDKLVAESATLAMGLLGR